MKKPAEQTAEFMRSYMTLENAKDYCSMMRREYRGVNPTLSDYWKQVKLNLEK